MSGNTSGVFDAAAADAADPVLLVRDLEVRFMLDSGTVEAVNGAGFEVPRGKTVCVVGETGAGKSVTAFSVMRLIGAGGTSRRARLTGDILLRPGGGREYNIPRLTEEQMRSIRGRLVSMIYQEPMNSLNPVFPCGDQIAEVLTHHGGKTRGEAMEHAEQLLSSVGIPDPSRVVHSYPHELSGGMRQRVMIAMALALHPVLLIADEPTTSVDVTIQAQILNLFKMIQRTSGTSILFITHDVSVVAQLADRVVVMYAGRTVETAPVHDLFRRPLHPYTKGLLASIPRAPMPGEPPRRLTPIPGSVPNPASLPSGCPFHPRCPGVVDRCRSLVPRQESAEPKRTVMCHRWAELQEDSR